MSPIPSKNEPTDLKSIAMNRLKEAIPLRELYVRIYGVEPDRGQLQQFRNRLNPNRSNLTLEMLGTCISNLPELQDMTLGEFFGIK